MTTAVGKGLRPAASKRRTRRPAVTPQSVHSISERELTDRLVDRVVLGIVRSQLALQPASVKSSTDAPAMLANARRWTMQLLTFLAAARHGQLPRPRIRQGAAILQSAFDLSNESRTRRSNLILLEKYLQDAAESWSILAPDQAASPTIAEKSASQTAVAESNAYLARALAAVLGDSPLDRPSAPGVESFEAAIEQGIPGFTPRVLGSLHETLLGRRLRIADDGPRWIDDHGNRRKSGSFYTPERLVRLLIEKTLGPVLRPRLRRCVRKLTGLSAGESETSAPGLALIDPAMGSGHFLAAAVEYATQAIIRASEKNNVPAIELARLIARPNRRISLPQSTRRPHDTTDIQSTVKQVLLAHSIFGVDTDIESVELARLSLWLDSGLPSHRVKCLVGNLSTGDSLLTEISGRGRRTQFDAIIGNPPYGTPDAEYRQHLHKALPRTRHNADLAAAFVERSLSLVAPQGQVGLVLPKPLTYSFAWRHLRQSLQGRITWVCDVRRGWEQVLAEQVLLVFSGQATARDAYQVGTLAAAQDRVLPDIPRAWTDRFAVLLSSLSTDDCRRLAAMRFATQTVGDLCRTFRGLPWQRRLSAAGEVPVYGGRDLQRWSVRSISGFLASEAEVDQLNTFAQPKLLFQNIIAHIERPEPHVRLIGTFDPHGAITLDTVNNLVPRAEGVNLKAILALLHSSTANWLVYAVVYNRAIRTMHFDQYFLDKIPLPVDWERLAPRLAELSKICLATIERLAQEPPGTQSSRRTAKLLAKLEAAQIEIDRIVAQAYGDR